jgi:predicted dehydrogenase
MSLDDPQFGRETTDLSGVLSLVKGNEIIEQAHPNMTPPTYGAFYENLADALAGRASVPVDAEDGLNIIYLIELAKKSAEVGQTLEVRGTREGS